jgi:hypothetical protein
MKNLNRIIVLVALLATSLSSCNKEDDVDVRFAVNAGVGGIYIDISNLVIVRVGIRAGITTQMDIRVDWNQSNEFSFLLVMCWVNPVSNTNPSRVLDTKWQNILIASKWYA